ncbi:MAG: HEAT repeat domain-containing protein, partial [Candidatus Aminicenantes bacterium]|nr:HEAT repeat domain-containing protein [Candidatus Aminicenantes bacterium]
RSQAAAKKIIKYADSKDKNLRQITLYALANIGDPASGKALDKVRVAATPYERAKAPSLYLLYAQRLAESGRKGQCARICRDLITYYTAPHETNVPCTALSILINVLGGSAFGDLLAAMDSQNKELRWRALELASTIQGKDATGRWVEKMEEVSPETQAEIITMLGGRGDKSVLPVLMQSLISNEKVVRLAAIPAASQLGGSDVLTDLLALLQTNEADEIKAVKQALMCLPGPKVVPEAAKVLEEVPPLGRVALIEILSERRAKEHVDIIFAQTKSENDKVRVAAVRGLEHLVSEKDLPRLIDILIEAQNNTEILLAQNAAVASANQISDPEKRADMFLEKLEKTTGAKRADLLKPLARIGGKNALQTVVTETQNEDPIVQDTAVFTLAKWLDLSAADELISIYRSTEKRKHLHLAIKGYVRLVKEAELAPEDKLGMLKEALNIAAENEEKNLVLSGLASVKTLDSLKLVAAYLDDQDLKSRAASIAARIVLPQPGTDKGLTGAEVISVLKKAARIIENSYERERIEKYIGA